MKQPDPRRVALEVLIEVERSHAFADALLGRTLDSSPMIPADRRLTTLLVYGTLARQRTLDHTLGLYCRRSLTRLDRTIHTILRLGLFQIAFLDRVPPYAAVDSAVSLARLELPEAAGMVNAVLRRATRDGLARLPDQSDVERLSVEYSHPPWLVDRWLEELGREETIALMAANNEPMANVLRALADRDSVVKAMQAAGFKAQPARHAPDGIVASTGKALPGLALPQGEASQLVVLMLAVRHGDRVLDACAAPGSKTAYLAALSGAAGSVVAVDPAPGAGRRIRKTLDAAKIGDVEIVETAIERASGLGTFDAVLVDAPCTGLGTLREHPEIRWRRSPEDLVRAGLRQRVVLEAASALLRPGGRLVYATCTLVHAENDEVVQWFLKQHPDFTESSGAPPHPALAGLLDQQGRLRTFPHRHDMAGFFAARFQRMPAGPERGAIITG